MTQRPYDRDHPHPNACIPADVYSQQTQANTGMAWLQDDTPVDVDLEGMAGYAKNMMVVQEHVRSDQGNLDLLGNFPFKAWHGSVINEAGYVRSHMTANYTELMNYLAHLQQGLMNIGMAAQTVADAYQGTDGTSAASLDAVKFAFGDTTVAPPGDLPPMEYKTWWDAQQEASQQGEEKAASIAMFGDQNTWDERTNPDGSVTRFAKGPDGQRIEITTTSIPTTSIQITTTVIYGPGDHVLSRTEETRYSDMHSQSSSTVNPDGTRTVTTESTQRGDGKASVETTQTTQYGKDGSTTTTTTTTTTSKDGSQVISTTRSEDGKPADEVRRLEIGAATDGVSSRLDSPADDAVKDLTKR